MVAMAAASEGSEISRSLLGKAPDTSCVSQSKPFLDKSACERRDASPKPDSFLSGPNKRTLGVVPELGVKRLAGESLCFAKSCGVACEGGMRTSWGRRGRSCGTFPAT